MNARILLIPCLMFGFAGFARTTHAQLSEGFDHFYNLEYDEAITAFREMTHEQPESAAARNHLAQAILYRAMFHAGALESELVSGTNPFLRRPKMNPSPEDEKLFDDSIARSISISEARLQADPDETRALYELGVAYGLRANYNFLVRKAWFDALRDATRARKLHSRVTQLNPRMVDARLVQGVHDYVVGSLPWHVKMLGFLVGFRGDKALGIRTLEYVAEHGDVNRIDAQILLCALYRRERDVKRAVPLLLGLIGQFPRNYILRFELVQMYSDLGDKKSALAAVHKIEEMRAAGAFGYTNLPQEKIYYARGTVQFWYNDLDRALDNMKRVAARSGVLDLNTGTYAWLRMGQIYDLKGQRTHAVSAYQTAIRIAPESDAARLSKRYLSEPYRRKKQGT